MSTAIKRRRGTTTEHTTFTGLEGELTVDTTKDTVVVHDGTTVGGVPLLRQDLSNNTAVVTASGTQTLTNKTISLTSNTVTGTLAVANGGTGLGTLTANNVVVGNGTSTPLFVAPGTSGNVLTSDGTTWASTAATGGTTDKIEEGDSKVEVTDAGTGKVEITVDAVEVADFTTGAIVFNETGANQDFRVEGDTNANLLFVDASTDRVGVGTSSPVRPLSVVGIMRVDGGATNAASIDISPNATPSEGVTLDVSFIGTGSFGPLKILTGGGTEAARITSDGSFFVGSTTTPSGSIGGSGFLTTTNSRRQLHLATTVTSGQTLVVFTNPNGIVGAISTDGSSTLFQTSSDYRLKHDIQPMTGALAKVQQLKPVTYKWNADDSNGQGFIAHELAEVEPGCVSGEKDAVETYTDEEGVEQTRPVHQGVDTSFLVATLTAAIQELKVELDQAKTRIEALEAQ